MTAREDSCLLPAFSVFFFFCSLFAPVRAPEFFVFFLRFLFPPTSPDPPKISVRPSAGYPRVARRRADEGRATTQLSELSTIT